MKGHFAHEGIELLQLDTLGGVLFVFGRDVAAHAWDAARLLLSAFQDNLNAVAFFCHRSCG